MPFKPPEVKMGKRDFQYYCDYLIKSLLQYDMDTVIKGEGTAVVRSVEALNYVSKKLEKSEYGVVKVRYGKIKLGQSLKEDTRMVSYIEIPCKIVTEEVEGYRVIRDLNQNPWRGSLEEVDERWRDELVDVYFRRLVNNKQMNIVGYGLHMIDAISIFNIMRLRITALEVSYQDAEVGSILKHKNAYKCAIKIDVTAKEKTK